MTYDNLVKLKVEDFQDKYLKGQNLSLVLFKETPKTWGQGVQGAYLPHSKEVVLCLDNIKNMEELELTLKHEVLGHFALNTLEENQKVMLLKSIAKTKGDADLEDIKQYVAKNYSNLSELKKAEEVFALVAETIREQAEIVPESKRKISLEGNMDKETIYIIAKSISKGLICGKVKQQIFPASNAGQFESYVERKLMKADNKRLTI